MSDLKRWCQYSPADGEPIMCLAPKVDRIVKRVFIIRHAEAYKFTDPMFIRMYAFQVADKLDLGILTVKRLTEIRTIIEDGLDELVGMKPVEAVYDDKPQPIGEGTLTVNDGTKIDFVVTNELYDSEG